MIRRILVCVFYPPLHSLKFDHAARDFDALNPSHGSACTAKPDFLPFPEKRIIQKPIRIHPGLIVVLLCLTLLATVLPIPAVFAEGNTGNTGITLGSGAIEKGVQVYFGTYNENPVLWQVMGDGNNGDGMLLLSKYLLDKTWFNPGTIDDLLRNVWQGSKAQSWCYDFHSRVFTEAEKLSMICTSKEDKSCTVDNFNFGTSSLNNEYVFFISAEEVVKYFPNNESRIAIYEVESKVDDWWLRSPRANHTQAYARAGCVKSDGLVGSLTTETPLCARPAFNLDLASVIFSYEISSNQYKLTLKDPNLSISAPDASKSGSTVTVPCSISGEYDRIWLVMTNGEWNDQSGWSSGAAVKHSEILTLSNGSVSFTLPSDYDTSWKTWLIAEKVNTGNLTNYGSAPAEITISEEDGMELPVEISVVQGNGEKGVPDDVKARTIRLTIRLKQNGELKLSSAPIELAVTPGGNREPAEFDAVTFMPDTPDFQETCGNYEYEVLVTPKEVKADIAGAGDDGPAYLLKAAAGSPDCEKFVVTLYWNNKAASEPEVIRVVALPEDEIGAYKLRADGTKEYLLFQTYDICMTYLGRDELCRGPERCYHK